MTGEPTQKQGDNGSILTSSGLSVANSAVLYLFRKTEKVTTALYLVTDLFPEREPLRIELRTLALRLLSLLFPTPRGSGAARFTEEIHPTASRVVSLLELAHNTGLISEMNHIVLRDEYTNLINAVKEQVKAHSFDFSINKSVFSSSESIPARQEVPSPVLKEPTTVAGGDMSFSGSVKDKSKGHRIKDNRPVPANDPRTPRRANTQRDPARREIILNMLKKHGIISIKDVVGIVSGCSEKTIQREFTILVNEGVVKREGKRRWSRYSLVEKQ